MHCGRRIGRGRALALQGDRQRVALAHARVRTSGCSPCSNIQERDARCRGIRRTTSRSTCSRCGVRLHAQEPDCPRLAARRRFVIDFAYAIHSNIGDHSPRRRASSKRGPVRCAPNCKQRRCRWKSLLRPCSTPNPAWLGFVVRTGRAHDQIRHYPQDPEAHAESDRPRRAAWPRRCAPAAATSVPDWRIPPRRSSGKSCCALRPRPLAFELMTDIGLGRRIASIVAKRLMFLLSERGEKPDALLLTRERFTAPWLRLAKAPCHSSTAAENSSASLRALLRAHSRRSHRRLPAATAKGLVVHVRRMRASASACGTAMQRNAVFAVCSGPPRSGPPSRPAWIVTVRNEQGVLARVALAEAEADIERHVGVNGEDDETPRGFDRPALP